MTRPADYSELETYEEMTRAEFCMRWSGDSAGYIPRTRRMVRSTSLRRAAGATSGRGSFSGIFM